MRFSQLYAVSLDGCRLVVCMKARRARTTYTSVGFHLPSALCLLFRRWLHVGGG